MAEGGEKLDGVEKAAILLLSIGEDVASEIMKYLNPAEVQKIGSQMSKIEDLTQDKLIEVSKDFQEDIGSKVTIGGNDYIKSVLTKALGNETADMVIGRIGEGVEGSGLDALKWMDAKVVSDIIANEHPQTIAVILSHLEPEQSGEVMSFFRPNRRSEIIMRLATLESITPGAMRELEESINQQLSGSMSTHNRAVGGVKLAAEILNQMDSSSESEILSEIEKTDGELAGNIQEQMFVFADLTQLDDRGIQALLKEVSSDQLSVALKVAEDEFKEMIFRNMSERARDMLKEDMETRGPMKLSEVESIQQEIVKLAKKLADEGTIVLGGAGGEEVLV